MKGENNTGLQRTLNTLDVLVVAFGAMIGWGWVVSSGQWITTGGALGTAIAFVIGGIMIYLVGLTYAELTTAMPKNGGAQNFSYAAFGATGSFICTWALILSYVGVVCFEAVSLPTIIQYIFPGFQKGYLYTIMGFDIYLSWLIIAILTAAFIVYINIKGTKVAAKFQTILTIIIAGVGIILVVASALNGDTDNIDSQMFIGRNTDSIASNILKVSIMTPFFLFGFDVIPQAAEEIKIPLKKLGKIMLLSIILAVVFYALVVLAVGYTMNKDEIHAAMQGDGLVTATAMEIAFNNTTMAKVLIIGGLCGIITSWNSFLIGGSRILYSMSKSHMIPKAFSRLHHKYGTPIVSLLLLGAISIFSLFFGRVMLIWIVDAANFACCLAYCIVSMSFLVLRYKKPEMPRPYRVKNGKTIGTFAVIMSGFMAFMYIIPNTNCSLIWQEWIIVGGWILCGIVLAIRSKRIYKEKFASGMNF